MIKKVLYTVILFAAVDFACLAQSEEPSVYKIRKMSFSEGIYSDISPVIIKNGIIFCSDRRFSSLKDRTGFDGKRIYNIYIVWRKDSSDWGKPQEIKGERTNLFNNGPLCIAPDGKTLYFTSETETGRASAKRKFKNHSGIFIGELEGTNLVSVRPFEYNNTAYDIGQPSISPDGKLLFFASNMPGGLGGSDLYCCELTDGKWGDPVNLGPDVNSSGIENYPFMHSSGNLYFSSDRPGGMGKMDIYFTSRNSGKWDTPERMPEPFNTPSDDFAFVADSNMQTGYFASDRLKNDDLYQFTSTIIRKAQCDTLVENNYCYEMTEENAVKFDTLPFRYEWKFGDGKTGIGASVIHCYPGPGSYLVQLDVVNLITKEVQYNEKTYNLRIVDTQQPYITCPDTAGMDRNLKFDALKTNLPGWNISKYYWNFGDETIGIGKEVNKTYKKPGVYNVQLIVTGTHGTGGINRDLCVCKNIIITP